MRNFGTQNFTLMFVLYGIGRKHCALYLITMYGILIILMHKTLCSDFISLQHFSVPPGHLGSIFAIILTWKRIALDEKWACVVSKIYRIRILTFIFSSGHRCMGHTSVILSHHCLCDPNFMTLRPALWNIIHLTDYVRFVNLKIPFFAHC